MPNVVSVVEEDHGPGHTVRRRARVFIIPTGSQAGVRLYQ